MKRRSVLLGSALLALREVLGARADQPEERRACQPPPAITRVTPQPMDLSNCDFHGYDLRGRDFAWKNLEDASFVGADLRGAVFYHAHLEHACLVDADLRGATLDWAHTWGAIFCNTRIGDNVFLDVGCEQISERCRQNR